MLDRAASAALSLPPLAGCSDIEALAKETHKFESRYLDQLIGPYPERKDSMASRDSLLLIAEALLVQI